MSPICRLHNPPADIALQNEFVEEVFERLLACIASNVGIIKIGVVLDHRSMLQSASLKTALHERVGFV